MVETGLDFEGGDDVSKETNIVYDNLVKDSVLGQITRPKEKSWKKFQWTHTHTHTLVSMEVWETLLGCKQNFVVGSGVSDKDRHG